MKYFFLGLLLAISSTHAIAQGDEIEHMSVHSHRFEDRMILKPKLEEYSTMFELFEPLDVKIVQKFPNHKSIRSIPTSHDLSRIYEIFFDPESINLDWLIKKCEQSTLFEYVQPHYIAEIQFTPNDPMISSQMHLDIINAYAAWDIATGSTNQVIGIIDTGIDIDHIDLIGNIALNNADPIDGVDNDGDGFIDNFFGWDVVNNESDVQVGSVDHGVHVAGCAGASTNNNIGVAGTGFDCKILPIQAGDAGFITHGYEGMVYAADHGATIINCSWASLYGGAYEQDIVDYCENVNGALVVAAVGNNNSETKYYPACLPNVLGVAATNNDDTKWLGTNYGYYIGICAPATVLSTVDDGVYDTQSGTSMAAPLVAGAAAILKDMNPMWTPAQLRHQLQITSDNIYQLSGNQLYIDKLGKGRLNMVAALSGMTMPSLEFLEWSATDTDDDMFVAGDTVQITGVTTNFLSPISNVTTTISSSSPWIAVINSEISLGTLSTLQSFDHMFDPFTFEVLPGVPMNENIIFSIDYDNGSFSQTQFIEIQLNGDYISFAVNDIATTMTSTSFIGYNQQDQVTGFGFKYKESSSLLYEGGLMIGVPGIVVDKMRGDNAQNDNDFSSETNISKDNISGISNFDTKGVFTDANGGDQIGVLVKHSSHAWVNPGHRGYVVVDYVVVNTSGSPIEDLYAGIFADWDIGVPSNNKVGTYGAKKMGYMYEVGGTGKYVGIQLLTSGEFIHHACDNDGGTNIKPNVSYSSDEKYTTLSTTIAAVGTGTGVDASHVVGSGPYSILPGDSISVSFALHAAENLAQLALSADSAYMKVNNDTLANNVVENYKRPNFLIYPNPTANLLYIQGAFSTHQNNLNISMYNALGQEFKLEVVGVSPSQVSIDVSILASGNYWFILAEQKFFFIKN